MKSYRKISIVALLTAVAMAGVSCKGCGSPPVAVPTYEEAVTENWRSFVSAGQYVGAAAVLLKLNGEVSGPGLSGQQIGRIAGSPCQESLSYLANQYLDDDAVRNALNLVRAGVQDPPPGYADGNPWKSATTDELVLKMLNFFAGWCTSLPRINGSYDNGLNEIQEISWLYYHNQAGQDFVQGRDPANRDQKLITGWKFTKDFTLQLGAFMDSPASDTYLQEWVDDPAIEITDYQRQTYVQYDSWNDFFSRELITDTANQTIPSRPVTMPDRDYVVVAPTDCIMNSLVQVLDSGGEKKRKILENPLQYDTVLDVKGIPISLDQLLTGVDEDLRQQFVEGSGQSCVLMPNTYHRFHAPVDGKVVYSDVVEQNTFGYFDWPNWVPSTGNVGEPGTDFSQFEMYQRGIVIMEVTYDNLIEKDHKAYVAVIPVGLESVGSVVLRVKKGDMVKKGYTELGNFYYGGSLNIILYSKGLASGVTHVRMGNQINVFNLGKKIE